MSKTDIYKGEEWKDTDCEWKGGKKIKKKDIGGKEDRWKRRR